MRVWIRSWGQGGGGVDWWGMYSEVHEVGYAW